MYNVTNNIWKKGADIVYCSSCGNVIQEGQKFCQRCGANVELISCDSLQENIVKIKEKNSYETNTSENKSNDTQSIENIQMKEQNKKVVKNKKSKKTTFLEKLVADVIIVLGVGAMVYLVMNWFTVNSVKNSSPSYYMYTNVKYGESFESFFENTKWFFSMTEDNKICVQFAGECCDKNGNVMLVEVQFTKTRQDWWDIEYVKYDSVKQSIYEMENFMDIVFTVGDDEMIENMGIIYTINDYPEEMSMNEQQIPDMNEINLLTEDMTGVYYDAQFDNTLVIVRQIDSAGICIYHLAHYLGDDMEVLEYGCNVVSASWGNYIGGQWYSVSINNNGTLGISGGTGGYGGNYEKISSYAEIQISEVGEYTNVGNVNGYSIMNIEIIRPEGNVYR